MDAERKPDPSPAEIAARAAEIRAGWSEKERAKRQLVKPVPWSVPRLLNEIHTKGGVHSAN